MPNHPPTPSDLEVARDIVNTNYSSFNGFYNVDNATNEIAHALAAARERERERCAALASDTYNALLIAAKGHDECGDYALGRRARDEARGVSRVEKRIRAGEQP